LTQIRYVEIIA